MAVWLGGFSPIWLASDPQHPREADKKLGLEHAVARGAVTCIIQTISLQFHPRQAQKKGNFEGKKKLFLLLVDRVELFAETKTHVFVFVRLFFLQLREAKTNTGDEGLRRAEQKSQLKNIS